MSAHLAHGSHYQVLVPHLLDHAMIQKKARWGLGHSPWLREGRGWHAGLPTGVVAHVRLGHCGQRWFKVNRLSEQHCALSADARNQQVLPSPPLPSPLCRRWLQPG